MTGSSKSNWKKAQQILKEWKTSIGSTDSIDVSRFYDKSMKLKRVHAVKKSEPESETHGKRKIQMGGS